MNNLWNIILDIVTNRMGDEVKLNLRIPGLFILTFPIFVIIYVVMVIRKKKENRNKNEMNSKPETENDHFDDGRK